MGTISQRRIEKIQDLKREGKSITQIQKKVGVSNKTVIKYCRGITADKQESVEELASQVDVPLEPRVIHPTEVTVQSPRRAVEEPQEVIPGLLEETPVEFIQAPEDIIVEVKGIPVSRKVQLSPKNLMMFGWFQKRYSWDGDLSDFIDDTMTYFFENKLGAEVQINIKEVIY